MAAQVRLASFHQVLVLSLDLKLSDLGSSTSTLHHAPLETPRLSIHTTMSYSHRSTQRQADKQRLYEFVDNSSKWLMEDEDDMAQYFKHFNTISKPLLYFHRISRMDCNKLFWQGFHPDDRARLLPYLGGRHSIRQPGEKFNFQELFDRVHAVFSQWRLEDEEAEAEAVQWQREHDWELEQLIRGMWARSSDNPTYAVLYRQCARHFPNALRGVPKPEPLPKPVQDAPPQKSVCVRRAQPAHWSPACTPSPPVLETPMLPTNIVASTPTAPV